MAVTEKSVKTKQGYTVTKIVGTSILFQATEETIRSFLSTIPSRNALLVSQHGYLFSTSEIRPAAYGMKIRYILSEHAEIIWENQESIEKTNLQRMHEQIPDSPY